MEAVVAGVLAVLVAVSAMAMEAGKQYSAHDAEQYKLSAERDGPFTHRRKAIDGKTDQEEESLYKNLLPPDTLKDTESRLKRFEEARNDAEEAYKTAILNTQNAEDHGWISRDQAARKNIADAKALEAELQKIINDMALLGAARPDDASTLGIAAKIKTLQTEQRGAAIKGSESDPNSMNQALVNFNKNLISMGDSAKRNAAILNATLKPAIDGVSKGIYGAITGTVSWGQAFQQAGAQIVQSLIQIGVEMLAQHILSMFIKKTEKTATASDTITKAYNAATGAMSSVASIPVVGWILAPIAFAAILAMGLAAAAFDEGGYTGHGGRLQPAGIVHKGEVVIPADTVSDLGPMHFARYFGGRLPGYDMGGFVGSPATAPSMGSMPGTGGGGSNVNVNMALVNTRQDQRAFQAKDGWKVVLDQLTKRSNVFKA